MIGYNMRFHPIISFLKKIYKNKRYGKLVSANFKNLTYVPSHHPYENYKTGYAVKRQLGGGVLNSLIHEVDLIAYFFGLPNSLFVNKFNSKILNIDVDDNLSSIMIYKNFKQKFYLNLNLSMTSLKEERTVNFVYQNFTIDCNLIKNIIKINNNKSKKIVFKRQFKTKRNIMFLKEVVYFKKSILKTKQNFSSIKNNLNTMKLFNMLKNFKN
jgi:predicted dehydrogenase